MRKPAPFWVFLIWRIVLQIGILITIPIWVPILLIVWMVTAVINIGVEFVEDVQKDYQRKTNA